jgi:hypothetical protein
VTFQRDKKHAIMTRPMAQAASLCLSSLEVELLTKRASSTTIAAPLFSLACPHPHDKHAPPFSNKGKKEKETKGGTSSRPK